MIYPPEGSGFLLFGRRFPGFRQIRNAISRRGGLRSSFVKGILKLRSYGIQGFFQALLREGSRMGYSEWIKAHESLDESTRQDGRALAKSLSSRPKISILLPVFDPPEAFLREAIESVRRQIYDHWELCIVDDASTQPWVRRVLEEVASADHRVKLHFRTENGRVARCSNEALSRATGDFIALLDQDDCLSEDALLRIVEVLNCCPDADLLYSDEDKIDANGQRFDPHFKKDYDPLLLLAQNMICHLGVFRRSRVLEVGGFRERFDGAQDWDLVLRVIEKTSFDRVHHIPRVLYHWRAHETSTAYSIKAKGYAIEAGRMAVEDHLQRTGRKASVEKAPDADQYLRVRFERSLEPPTLTLIIPTRDRLDCLQPCIESILERSSYPSYDILIVDNDSTEPDTHAFLQGIASDKVRVLPVAGDFNFSRLNNRAVAETTSEIVCLVNNDIVALTPDWMEEMVSFAVQPQTGCVGARLWFPDETLQHGGVILGIGGIAGHAHRGLHRGERGYFGRAVLHQEFSAVTGACLMIRRALYLEVGGLDEALAVAYNDIDFCLRVDRAGYRTVWTPYAELLHYESASRGLEDNPWKVERLNREAALMKARWGDALTLDPAYNPNLTLDFEDFSLASNPRQSPLSSRAVFHS